MSNIRSKIRLVIAMLLSVLTLTVNVAHAAPPQSQVISIAQARKLSLGTTVTVQGRVSTPSGVFASSFFDMGFGLQDPSAGIYVSIQTNLYLKPGREARVTGQLMDSAGLLILVPASPNDVKIGEDEGAVKPQRVPTGAISEATEGRIVQVKGTITQAPASDLPYGYKLYVNDGSGEIRIYVNLQTGIDVTKLELGQRVSVAGFSSQFETYEIDPRSPSDIKVLEH